MPDHMSLKWDGLDEMRRMLRMTPAEVQPEVITLVLYHARWAEGALLAAYPTVTGNLRRGVRLQQSTKSKGGGPAAVLVSKAPHAWIYEKGTRPRFTKKGVPRGFSPEHYTFARVVAPQRQRMIDDLAQLLVRRGFEVHDVA